MTSLPFIPIAEIDSRDCVFRCDVYNASISAGCCALRQAKARARIDREAHRECESCAVGRVVERLSGGPVEVDKRKHGRAEKSRAIGGHNGSSVLKAKARRAREAKEAAANGSEEM